MNWRKTVGTDKTNETNTQRVARQNKPHREWVAEQLAMARENGIRDGLENMTAAQLIAALYHECATLATRVDILEKQLRDKTDTVAMLHVRGRQ